MRIGWNGGGHQRSLAAIRAEAGRAARDGFASFAEARLKPYGQLPAYRAMLEREGAPGPEALLAVGSEDAAREQLLRFEAAGATDLRVAPLCPTPDEAERTRALLRSLCRAGGPA
jgi:alkanesulfonate monooxygenase SsuD/methylene tetrahydromethanopterin reductase-like flavin-dependent oxidoreductase (luciferase family)